MSSSFYIACDLGAESGRVMLGELTENCHLTLEEIHRFPNIPVQLGDSTRWDALGIFHELKSGLKKIASRKIAARSLSVDSWGVDYVWNGAGQPLLAPPYIYRDARNDASYEKTQREIGRDRIYSETGIQSMVFNTIYQLMADVEKSPKLLELADGFLTMADFYNFLFSGVRCIEVSLASTTQIYNPLTRSWSEDLIQATGLPKHIFPEIVPSGSLLGPLTPDVVSETGLSGTNVVATCSHDTGAAVAAVPAVGHDWAYLSCGTWSLIGVELEKPLISPEARDANFTNEQGYGGTTRFLKNIVGLWILQECRREWEHTNRASDYAGLNKLAAGAAPLRSLIDPDDARFLKPGDMPAKIEAFCQETNQPVPESEGEFTRCILESLAMLYRETLTTIETLTQRTIRVLHIVGGGSQSALLNQFAANATGRTVVAGPVEATAIGNVLIQAIVDNQILSLADLRETVKRSFPGTEFLPADKDVWLEAGERFAKIRNR